MKKVLKNVAYQEILKCAADPVYFINTYCKVQHPKRGLVPFQLYHYQISAIKAFLNNEKIIVNKARQLGYSTVVAAFISWLILFHRDKSVLVLATKADVAKNMIRKIKVMLSYLPDWMYLADITTKQAHMVGLSNGSWVKSVATSEDAGRSEALSLLVIDEAAHIQKLDEIWKSVGSTIATGGKVLALSCVTKDTIIITDNGPQTIESFIPEKGLVGDYKINSYSVLGKNKTRSSNLFHNNGKVKTRKIITKFTELEGSGNHKLWACKDGIYDWFTLDQLSEGDWVNVQFGANLWGNNDLVNDFSPSKSGNIKNIFCPKKLTPDICYILGLYLAEGSSFRVCNENKELTGGNITFTCGDNIRPELEKLGLHISCHDEMHYTISSKNLVEFFEYLGFDLSKKAHEKEIPERLFSISKENICALLSGIYDGDGTAPNENREPRVSIGLSSKKLINQIRMLLLNLGILTTYTIRTVEKLNKNNTFCYKFKHDSHIIGATGRNAIRFFDTVGFRLQRKQNQRKENKTNRISTHDIIPFGAFYVRQMFDAHPKGLWTFKKHYGLSLGSIVNKTTEYDTPHVSRDVFNRMLSICAPFMDENFKNEIDKLCLENSCWVKIKEIIDSENETFDFSLPESLDDNWCHSIVYNGLLGHQTPAGVGNWFHKYFTEANSGINGFYPLVTHWWENPDYAEGLKDDPSVPGGKTSPWFENMTAGWSKSEIAQELLTSFIDSGDTFIDAAIIEYYQTQIQDPIEKLLLKNGTDSKFWIWERPMPSGRYLVVGDTAGGTRRGDFSGAIVLDLVNCRVVAEYKNKLPPDEFADRLVEVASLYNQAYIIVENNGNGMATAITLKRIDYPHLGYINPSNGQLIDKWTAEHEGINPGYNVGPTNRPVILARFQEFLNKKILITNSGRFVNELLTFVVENGKPQASKGHHDDLVMCYALAIWVRDICPQFFSHNSSAEDLIKLYSAVTVSRTQFKEYTEQVDKIREDRRQAEAMGLPPWLHHIYKS